MKKYYKINTKSFKDEGVKTYQELWEKVKGEYDGLMVDAHTEFKKKAKDDDKPNLYKFTLSTANEDRHGDVVKQNWSLKNFKKNPVVLDSHQYGSIFSILGRVPKIAVKDNVLKGDIEFATMTMAGYMAEIMVEKGFVNAGSVGFIPLEFGEKGQIEKSELLEFSLVSVPANAEALIEKMAKEYATKDKGKPQDREEPVKPEITDKEKEERAERPRRASAIELLAKETTRRQDVVKRLAEELTSMSPENVEEKKRKLWKGLRVLLSKDNV